MSQKIYLTILKSGVYLSFLCVFFVFSNLLFPYITSKQIPFNILIEVLFVFWLAFIIKYPSWRPRRSLISVGLISFFIAILASCFVSVDFNLSFWGDAERMLGFFHLAHFLIYYFIIITVFRSWQDWRNLFIVSVITAVCVCLYSLSGKAYSTMGNTAYVSGYAIFNIYFALILFTRWLSKGREGKNDWLLGSLYIIATLIMLSVMKMTHTRGAYVGIGVSFLILLLFFIFLSKNKKIKIYSLLAGLAAAAVVSLIFIYPNSAIVKNSSILRTVAQINPQAVTFQTRLISWKTAAKDFPSHPILGTGHGNFAITFDKYFDPKFYRYTASETYFDRAHNNLVDITSTTGLVGILAYLSIFVFAAFYLVGGFRKKYISGADFSLLTCLIIAYFIQNLVVFDSFVTYITLMVMLGYIYWLSRRAEEGGGDIEPASGLNNKEIFIFLLAGAAMLAVIFQYNIRPWQMFAGTIRGQYAFAANDLAGGVEIYKEALSYNTVLDRDSRTSLINIVNTRPDLLQNLDGDKTKEILDYIIGLAEKNVEYNPADSLMQMNLSQVLNLAASYNRDNIDRFYFYSDRALEAADKSIEASPGRTRIYFVKAQVYMTRGELDKAKEVLGYAIGLDEEYSEGYCRLAKFLIYIEEEEGYASMDRCLELGGIDYVNSSEWARKAINHYAQQQDWDNLLILYEKLINIEPEDVKVLVNLSKIYVHFGENEKAIETAKKIIDIDPSLKGSVDEFIRSLNQ